MIPGFCLVLGCGGGPDSGPPQSGTTRAAPPAECAAAWAADEAQALVETLERATRSERPIWGDYALVDGTYVLYTDTAAADGTCVGAWHAGRAIAFAHLPDEPSLLTPLYGYYFADDWHGGPDEPYLERAAQPSSVRAWLEEHEVESAVVLPVTVEDFPIEMPALVKTQLAIHEGFHVQVQAPRWFASTGAWPAWDAQPDRAEVSACYTATEGVAEALEAERASLAQLVQSLLDGDRARACTAGAEFLERRAGRYDLLSGVSVTLADSAPGSCRQAEALMELEEGTADYASWTALYDLGMASREQLLRRYGAKQDDVFYLTGAMQLHAVQLMQRDRMLEITRAINASAGPETGSITSALGRAMETYCGETE